LKKGGRVRLSKVVKEGKGVKEKERDWERNKKSRLNGALYFFTLSPHQNDLNLA
jgi:hypothetical protein